MSARRRGPRAAGGDTREAILETARDQFSTLGYRATTLRGVGSAAGVDPRLVLHYFGSKRELFSAAVRLPVDPAALIGEVFANGATEVAEGVARALIGILEDPRTRQRALAVIRAAATEPEAAAIIREMLTQEALVPLTAAIVRDQPQLRASLIGSSFVGLAMARYVVAVEPLASTPPEQVVRAFAPVIAHYLDDDWTETPG